MDVCVSVYSGTPRVTIKHIFTSYSPPGWQLEPNAGRNAGLSGRASSRAVGPICGARGRGDESAHAAGGAGAARGYLLGLSHFCVICWVYYISVLCFFVHGCFIIGWLPRACSQRDMCSPPPDMMGDSTALQKHSRTTYPKTPSAMVCNQSTA